MNYTASEIQNIEAAAGLIAQGRADEVQEMHALYTSGEWRQFTADLEIDGKWRYRPTPKPVTRPWSKPEDVPGPVCWLRNKDRNAERASLEAMVSAVSERGITRFTDDIHFVAWSDTEKLSQLEHSTDRINWKPCTVTE